MLIHRNDELGLKNPDINLSEYVGKGKISVEADSRIDDGDLIHVGNIEFKVLFTPGHTCGGVSLYCEKGFNLDNRLILNYNDNSIIDGTRTNFDVFKIDYENGQVTNIERIEQ